MKVFSLVRTVILGWITINGIQIPITFGEEAFGASNGLLARGDRDRKNCAAFEKRFSLAAEGDDSGQTEIGTWPARALARDYGAIVNGVRF